MLTHSFFQKLGLVSVAAIGIYAILDTIKLGKRKIYGTSVRGPNDGRRLGLIERWYVAQHRSKQHTGFFIALEFDLGKDLLDLDLNAVKIVLRRVAMRFPWLRTRLRRDGVAGVDSCTNLSTVHHGISTGEMGTGESGEWGNDLYLSENSKHIGDHFELNEIPLPVGGLECLLEEEGKRVWSDDNPEAPLWRVSVVRDGFIVFSFHHLISDGIGGTEVVRAFLQESGSSPTASFPLPSEKQPLPPPMEDLCDVRMSVWQLLSTLLCNLTATHLAHKHWQGKAHSQGSLAENRTCAIQLEELNQSQTQKLRSNCRREGITVNALLVAALSKALAAHAASYPTIYPHTKKWYAINCPDVMHLSFQVACNARDLCDVSRTQLGNYLFGCNVQMQAVPDQNLVEYSKEFLKRMSYVKEWSLNTIGLTTFIRGDWIEFASGQKDVQPNGRSYSFEISNIGVVDIENTLPPDAWPLRAMWFGQGRNQTGNALQVCVATSTGSLRAVVSAVPQAVSRNALKEISTLWKNELLKFIC